MLSILELGFLPLISLSYYTFLLLLLEVKIHVVVVVENCRKGDGNFQNLFVHSQLNPLCAIRC